MSLPTEEGKYIARPIEWTVQEGETGNRLLQFVCRFGLVHHWNGAEWLSVEADQLSITGYFYLMKSDGPNETTIKNLAAALGWDGRTIHSLVNGNWAGVEVQITCREEEYQGKRRMKVKWIAPRDADPSGGGIEKADPQEIQSLDAKYGPMLRALNGGKPASPPAPPAKSNGAATAAAALNTAKKAAWDAFLVKWNEYAADNPSEASQPQRDAKWKEAIAEILGPADPKGFGTEQWKKLAEAIRTYWSPAVGTIPF